MKKSHLAIPLLLALGLSLAACGDDDDGGGDITVNVPPEGPTLGINVTGEGLVNVEPDLVNLNLGVEITEDNADLALVNANGAMENLLDVLDEAGIAEEDIQTTGISVQPFYDFSTETPLITGYTATNTVNVKVRDLDSVGDVIDGATSAAGNAVRVNYISFEREDETEAIAQAREQAVEDAKERAEGLAAGAGVELGPLQTLSETSFNEPPPVPFDQNRAFEESAGADAASTPVNPGTLQIRVSVVAVYGINQ